MAAQLLHGGMENLYSAHLFENCQPRGELSHNGLVNINLDDSGTLLIFVWP